MAKALVTGGAGFIGSHLTDRLLSDDWSVTVVDNLDPFYSPQTKLSNLDRHQSNPQFRFVEVDIRDLNAMRDQLTGDYDVIIHLAAKAGVRPSIEDPGTYAQVNVAGTQNILELAKEWNVQQFVFASSSSVYGVNPNVPWSEEDHGLRPISPYASTKVSGELLGHVYSHLYGIRFIALRFFTVYGPRQRPDLAIHKFARLLRAGAPLPVFGDGAMSRDYTFVEDIINGIEAAIHYTDTRYDIINLGNHRTVTIIEMIEALAGAMGMEPVLQFLPEQLGDVPRTYADTSKAQKLLGYEPATSFRQGIERFVDWFQGAARLPVSRSRIAAESPVGRTMTL